MSNLFSWPEYVNTHCRTKTGGINNRCSNKNWWPTEVLELLVDNTSWLPSTASVMQRLYHAYHSKNSIPLCSCGNPRNFKQFKSGYTDYCSVDCSLSSPIRAEKIQKTTNDRHGIERKGIVQKIKSTNNTKYGCDFTTQVKKIKEKIKQTKKIRYGDERYNNTNQAIATNMEKYGVAYTVQADSVKEKIRNTILNNYENKWITQQHLSQNIIEQLNDIETLQARNNNGESLVDIASSLGVTYRAVYLKFINNNVQPIFHTPQQKSKEQDKIYDFVISLGISAVKNTRSIIPPKELDIYIPEYKLAIEFNGCYWHSFDRIETKKEINQHNEKRKLCEDAGVRLIQIWDYQWDENPDICKSIIKRALGMTPYSVGARRCNIFEPTKQQVQNFTDTHHIQGHISYKKALALSNKDGDILQIITIGIPRWSKLAKWEILRLVTHTDYRIIGGLERLLSELGHRWPGKDNIMTYSDSMLFTGNGYKAAGFTLHHESPPSYNYWRRGEIFSRWQFQKHMLNKLPVFDSQLTEAENMFKNDYRRFWDCGTKVWMYTP